MTWRQGLFASLDLGCRAVLVELLRCVDKTAPRSEFRVHIGTLSARLDTSRATIGRRLRELKDSGWLQREQEMIDTRRRGFQVADSRLTTAAVAALGFTDPPESSVTEVCESLARHPIGIPLNSPLESKLPADTSADKASLEPHKAPQQLSPSTRVPAHLRPMLQVFTANAICGLMKRAKASGVRLEDVWVMREKAIRAARKPWAYTSSLIVSETDWNWILQSRAERIRVEEREAIAKGKADALKAELAQFIEAFNNKAFTKADGTKDFLILGEFVNVFWTEGGRKRSAAKRLDEKFMRDVQEGEIVQVGVQSASLGLTLH